MAEINSSDVEGSTEVSTSQAGQTTRATVTMVIEVVAASAQAPAETRFTRMGSRVGQRPARHNVSSAASGRKTPNTTIGPATGLIRSLANWCKRGATAALRVLLTMIRLITRGEYRKWPHLNNQRLSYSVFDRSLRRLRFQYAIREASCHRRRLLDSSPQR